MVDGNSQRFEDSVLSGEDVQDNVKNGAVARPEFNSRQDFPHLIRQRRQQFMQDMINEVGRYITSILDLDTLLWEVTRYTCEVFNAYGAAVGLIEDNELVLRIGAGKSGIHDIIRLSADNQGIATRVVALNQSEIVKDIAEDSCHNTLDLLPDVLSEMAVPILTHNGQIVGVLVAYSNRAGAFDDEDLRLLQMLTEHVAVAVINARLLAKQKVETWGSAVLLRVARMLSGMSDQQELIYAVLGLALDLTGAEHGALLTFPEVAGDGQTQNFYTSNETIQQVVDQFGSEWEGDLINRLQHLDQLQISYAHYALPEFEPMMSDLGLEVTMLAPIRVEGKTWGTLILGYASAHRFTRYDFNLIAGLAAQASAAIENTRLIKQVEDERSYLHAVIANTGEGLFLADNDGKLTYCNPRLEELVGVKYQDIIGLSYESLFSEISALSDRPQETQGELGEALENVNQQPAVNLYTVSPTETARLQIGLFPILDENMRSIGWGGLIRDTTAEWNEIIRCTGHMSMTTREMRTSLATVKGFVTTLLTSHRYWGEQERQEFLDNINRSVDQLGHILENTQEMTRLDMNMVELERSPSEIKTVIDRTLHQPHLQPVAGRFSVQVPEELPVAQIDARRIEQALHNLLGIAAQYSPGERKIPVQVQQEDSFIRLNITAQGIIPEEFLTYIFDRFYQSGSFDDSLIKGPGLGLYVARGLILAHGGRIWAETVDDRQTIISFTLPLESMVPAAQMAVRRPPAMESTVKRRPRTESVGVRPPQQALRVLVVEDDPYMVRLLKINLETEGYTVISATRGDTAIELANTEQPDIILLDIRLPDMDGFAVCSRVREFNKIVPIIMITGKSTEDDVVRGLQIGADDYLIKPLSHKELLARMHVLLQRSWMVGQDSPEPVFRTGDIAIDFAQRQVTAYGKPVKLTPTEYKLLYNLAVNAGRVLTHEQLLAAVWGPGVEHQTQYLWVNISRLRSKLEKDANNPDYILTEQGIGYMLAKE